MSYLSVNPNTGLQLKSFEHLTASQLEASLANGANPRFKSGSERPMPSGP